MRRYGRILVVTLVVGLVVGTAGLASGSEDVRTGTEAADGLPAPGEPWDLVYMTDSTGWGVPELYARRAEEVLDVEVRVHDMTSGGLSAVAIRERLDVSYYSDPIAGAEIVVVFGNPRNSGAHLPTPDIEQCTSASPYRRPPPARSDAEAWTPYREVLGSVFERIWELRQGKPTVFLAVDMYTPALGPWAEAGILPQCLHEWTVLSDQIRLAAEAHGVRMVSVFDALNGPDHDRDLVQLGWVRSDGQHLTAEGAAQIADALSAAGFEPSRPPRMLP